MSSQYSDTRDPEFLRHLRIGFGFPRVAVAGVMLLAACTTSHQPRYGDIAATVQPVSVDRARFYFYREYEPYESLARPYIYLNNQPSAVSEPGGVLYRDVPLGAYVVAVDSYGSFPEQPKTVTVRGGETYYVKIESLRSWISGGANKDYERDTFVVVLIDPERARREIAALDSLEHP